MLIPFDYLFREHKIKAPGALHIGANLGQEAEAYRKHGINQVIWIEALPEIHSRLVEAVSGYPGTRTFLACVSDKDGEEVIFNVASNGGQSSSFLELGTHAQEHPTVRYTKQIKMTTVRVDTLLEHHLDGDGWFLNIDLQGAELLALKGMGGLLKQFSHAYIEVNERELYKGCPLVHEIDEYLAGYGFKGMETKMTGSGWGDKYYRRMT